MYEKNGAQGNAWASFPQQDSKVKAPKSKVVTNSIEGDNVFGEQKEMITFESNNADRVVVTLAEALEWTGWDKYYLNRIAKEAGIRRIGASFYWEDFKSYWDFRNSFSASPLYKVFDRNDRKIFVSVNWKRGIEYIDELCSKAS